MPDDTCPIKADSGPLIQTEKPVVFNNHHCQPLAWERLGNWYLGRHRGCSLAILQINLEPHHSLVKELLVIFWRDDEIPPNAGESAEQTAADSFELGKSCQRLGSDSRHQLTASDPSGRGWHYCDERQKS